MYIPFLAPNQFTLAPKPLRTFEKDQMEVKAMLFELMMKSKLHLAIKIYDDYPQKQAKMSNCAN